MSQDRQHEIDVLRGIACTTVVAFHYLYRGQQDDWITDSAPPMLAEIARYGYLGVSLFFLISGYVIFHSAQGATVRAFAASRVARLYPAYWVSVCLTAGVVWALASSTFAVGLRDDLLNLTMVMHWLPDALGVALVDGAYWSLAVEFQFYLLMGAVLWVGALARIEALLVVWLLLSIADFVRRVYLPEVWLALQWAPLFSAGILFHRIRHAGWTRQRYLLLWCCFLVTLARATAPDELAKGAADGSVRSGWVVAAVLTLCFAVFAWIAAGRWRLRGSWVTRWIGALTYPVYLVHQNIGYLLLEAWKPSGLGLGLRLAGVVVVVLGVSVLIHRGVERPLGPRLRRWIHPVVVAPA
ncbi:acyltransferase family protein [Sphaerotilus sp.]|jgi:peptidoglycan/LPS O-acetylase OafA/YrhL|uniref:acyltransferase family protein n=1 Tax=Sphaerotilus sp. TaxID=2093942 RepID=UPI0025E206B0|nr:acyltransferase [Sphaerotilus sp.]